MNSWVLYSDSIMVNLATGFRLDCNIAAKTIKYFNVPVGGTALITLSYTSSEVVQQKWQQLTSMLAAPYSAFRISEG